MIKIVCIPGLAVKNSRSFTKFRITSIAVRRQENLPAMNAKLFTEFLPTGNFLCKKQAISNY